jgi:formylaminopyrimidine deformylase / aminopyrimidine aminohydrolase
VSTSRKLLAHSAKLWPRVIGHPFLYAVADVSLDRDAFERWLVAEYAFNVELRRFIAGLVTIAPTGWDADVIAGGLGPNKCDIDLVRSAAVRQGFDVDAEPGPSTIGFAGYLQSLPQRGYEVALAGLYGTQKVYYEGWSSIRGRTTWTSPYWPLVDTWSAADRADRISGLCQLVDAAAPEGPSSPMCLAFDRVVRFALQFWTAVYVGEDW